MRWFTLNNVCHYGLFAYLVFFSYLSFTAAVGFDLTEFRNRIARFPKGKLWATGHFMGKRTVDSPPMPSFDGQDFDAPEVTLPAERSVLELYQVYPPLALQAQVDKRESRTTKREADMLMKIFERYVQSRK